jgi:ankyrin repeat protein
LGLLLPLLSATFRKISRQDLRNSVALDDRRHVVEEGYIERFESKNPNMSPLWYFIKESNAEIQKPLLAEMGFKKEKKWSWKRLFSRKKEDECSTCSGVNRRQSSVYPHTEGFDKQYPIVWSAMANRLDLIKMFHEKYAFSVKEMENRTDNTPILWAVKNGNLQMLEYLMVHGAYLNVRDRQTNDNPLTLSARRNYEEITLLLVKHTEKIKGKERIYFLNVDHQGFLGSTALHWVSYHNNVDLASILLFKRKASHMIRDSLGKTVLHYAVMGKSPDVLDFFTKLNSLHLFTITDLKGKTLLMYAAQYKCYECVQIILDTHVNDVNAFDHDGNTALHYAIYNQDGDIVDLLIDAQAEVLSLNKLLYSPFKLAIKIGCNRTISVLVEKMPWIIDVPLDPTGILPIVYSLFERRDDIAEYLIRRGCDMSLSFYSHALRMNITGSLVQGCLQSTRSSSCRKILQYLFERAHSKIFEEPYAFESRMMPRTVNSSSILNYRTFTRKLSTVPEDEVIDFDGSGYEMVSPPSIDIQSTTIEVPLSDTAQEAIPIKPMKSKERIRPVTANDEESVTSLITTSTDVSRNMKTQNILDRIEEIKLVLDEESVEILTGITPNLTNNVDPSVLKTFYEDLIKLQGSLKPKGNAENV